MVGSSAEAPSSNTSMVPSITRGGDAMRPSKLRQIEYNRLSFSENICKDQYLTTSQQSFGQGRPAEPASPEDHRAVRFQHGRHKVLPNAVALRSLAPQPSPALTQLTSVQAPVLTLAPACLWQNFSGFSLAQRVASTPTAEHFLSTHDREFVGFSPREGQTRRSEIGRAMQANGIPIMTPSTREYSRDMYRTTADARDAAVKRSTFTVKGRYTHGGDFRNSSAVPMDRNLASHALVCPAEYETVSLRAYRDAHRSPDGGRALHRYELPQKNTSTIIKPSMQTIETKPNQRAVFGARQDRQSVQKQYVRGAPFSGKAHYESAHVAHYQPSDEPLVVPGGIGAWDVNKPSQPYVLGAPRRAEACRGRKSSMFGLKRGCGSSRGMGPRSWLLWGRTAHPWTPSGDWRPSLLPPRSRGQQRSASGSRQRAGSSMAGRARRLVCSSTRLRSVPCPFHRWHHAGGELL